MQLLHASLLVFMLKVSQVKKKKKKLSKGKQALNTLGFAAKSLKPTREKKNSKQAINNFTYLVEPTGALKDSPKQILSIALQGAGVNSLQGLFPLLGPWPFAS